MEKYIRPEIEILEIALEGGVLVGSPGDGSYDEREEYPGDWN